MADNSNESMILGRTQEWQEEFQLKSLIKGETKKLKSLLVSPLKM